MKWLLSWVPRETNEEEAVDEQPDGGNPPDGRPNYVPEKFWDDDVGVRVQPLAEAYVSLEGKVREREDQVIENWKAEQQANLPETYELDLGEDFEAPEGIEMTLTAEDPMVNWFFDKAKQWGLPQEEVTSAIREYVIAEIESMPKMEDELKALGDYGQDRLQRVHNWLNKSLDESEMAALTPMLATAASIQALEKLMKVPTAMNFDGDPPTPALTLDELRSMQNDPKYWRDKDPAYIKKVEQGYKRLYGES